MTMQLFPVSKEGKICISIYAFLIAMAEKHNWEFSELVKFFHAWHTTEFYKMYSGQAEIQFTEKDVRLLYDPVVGTADAGNRAQSFCRWLDRRFTHAMLSMDTMQFVVHHKK